MAWLANETWNSYRLSILQFLARWGVNDSKFSWLFGNLWICCKMTEEIEWLWKCKKYSMRFRQKLLSGISNIISSPLNSLTVKLHNKALLHIITSKFTNIYFNSAIFIFATHIIFYCSVSLHDSLAFLEMRTKIHSFLCRNKFAFAMSQSIGKQIVEARGQSWEYNFKIYCQNLHLWYSR